MYFLKPLTVGDLDIVLAWRNHPDVRKNMYTQHEISRDEHYAWFERIKGDETKRYLICMANEEPVGLINFVDINPTHKTASWGFYSGDVSKRGVGTQMEFLALNYAFEDLGLEKLCCEVLSFNASVISFHRKFGFDVEGIFRKQFFDGEQYHDIYRLAMFKADWLNHLQPKFRKKLSGEKTAKSPFDVGDSYEEHFSITSEQIRQYADLTGDRNPVHLSDQSAVEQGFEGLLAHGMLTAALFSKVLGTSFPGPGSIYTKQSLTFRRPVYPGQDLIVRAHVVSRKGRRLQLETVVYAPDKTVLLEGEAEVMIPKG